MPRTYYVVPLEEKLWQHVVKQPGEGCWEWTGPTRMHFGYGGIWHRGKKLRAHRVSWEIANGPVPDGLFVLHKCDNPPCVRPDHLYLGTNLDNARDRAARDRFDYRKRVHGMAKLNEEKVVWIMARLLTGRETQAEVAAAFGVHSISAHHIWSGKRWAYVFEEEL